MKTPVFSSSAARSSVFFAAAWRAYSQLVVVGVRAIRSTSGCSGASTKKVAPNSVSGRVVKTGMSVVELLDPEDDLGALGAADPVALDRLACARATRRRRQVELEQLVGVGGDLEEPLLEVAQLDLRAAAVAAAVEDLLVRDARSGRSGTS